MTDWTAYTAEQADEIDQMRRKVAAANARIAKQAEAIGKQNLRIDALTADGARHKRDLTARTGERDAVTADLAAASTDLTEANQIIAGLDATLQTVRKNLDSAQAAAVQQEERCRAAGEELTSRTRWIKVLLLIAFVLAIAAIAGWIH
ncbi:hypothetical protein [Nocardia tengchongensis]|uniref:hypothetical protein n=1 Tax=Nocardia tengchongensis TaxID=2055889 RepID=UPI0036B48A78